MTEAFNMCFVHTNIAISVIIIAGNEPSLTTQKDIKMKENVSYEFPPSRIKMAENEAYRTVPNRAQLLLTPAHDVKPILDIVCILVPFDI